MAAFSRPSSAVREVSLQPLTGGTWSSASMSGGGRRRNRCVGELQGEGLREVRTRTASRTQARKGAIRASRGRSSRRSGWPFRRTGEVEWRGSIRFGPGESRGGGSAVNSSRQTQLASEGVTRLLARVTHLYYLPRSPSSWFHPCSPPLAEHAPLDVGAAWRELVRVGNSQSSSEGRLAGLASVSVRSGCARPSFRRLTLYNSPLLP